MTLWQVTLVFNQASLQFFIYKEVRSFELLEEKSHLKEKIYSYVSQHTATETEKSIYRAPIYV